MTNRLQEPLPGRAFVGMHPMYSDYEGNVYIPRNAPSVKPSGRIGTVCSVTLYPEGKDSWQFDGGVRKLVPAWKKNKQYKRLLEKHVVCRNARLMWGMLFEVRLENIEAIVPDSFKVKFDPLGRCNRCLAPGGSAGILLGPDGFCPQCGFNNQDVHINELCVDIDLPDGTPLRVRDASRDVSEEDIDFLVRQPAEMDHIMRTHGKRLGSKTISMPGQKFPDFELEPTGEAEASEIIQGWMKERQGGSNE